MNFMEKALVSIVKCDIVDAFEAVHKAVKSSIDHIGSLDTFVNRNDSVLIKPNVLLDMDYKTGAVTNPHVVKSLVRLAREAGAGKITIAESSVVGCDTSKAFDKTGYTELASEENLELINLKKSSVIPMAIPNGKIFRRITLPEVIFKSDVIINVPVMKTHDMFPVTLGLKNMKGFLMDKDKKRFHVWGLAQAIVDLNKVVLPQITVIDGTVGMEGLGPANGTPVNLGLIISSYDTVAADSVASYVMGVDPETVKYIQLAGQQDLGCSDLSQIDVAGVPKDEAVRPFEVLQLDFETYEKENDVKIYESGACSGCRLAFKTFLFSYLKDNLSVLKGYTIIFGQTVKPPLKIKGKLLNYGSCTKKYKNQGEYIAGCPPMHEHVLEHFGLKPEA
jgi:uncharacterized protein (DUF362 family)